MALKKLLFPGGEFEGKVDRRCNLITRNMEELGWKHQLKKQNKETWRLRGLEDQVGINQWQIITVREYMHLWRSSITTSIRFHWKVMFQGGSEDYQIE